MWQRIEEEIDAIFADLFYKPMQAIMDEPHPEYYNAAPGESALDKAVSAGTVWYDDGAFHGQFNARISADLRKIGATYNMRSKTFSLLLADLPVDIRMSQARADGRYDALRRGLLRTLADINVESIDKVFQTTGAYRKTIEWINDDFEKTVKNIAIPATLTEGQRDQLASQWGQNLNLYIKKWSAKNIIELRAKIQDETFKGNRAASLEAMIKQNYGVSRRKAEFLARQETSLLLSKYRESRYAEIGVTEYKWSTSHDERVRSSHRHLNGKIFSFAFPPVTDPKTGARNNPGEDFNCRCVAIPVVN